MIISKCPSLSKLRNFHVFSSKFLRINSNFQSFFYRKVLTFEIKFSSSRKFLKKIECFYQTSDSEISTFFQTISENNLKVLCFVKQIDDFSNSDVSCFSQNFLRLISKFPCFSGKCSTFQTQKCSVCSSCFCL